tara:strand:- start:334 stop:705 length:372 start_codon:yes stop_codon:yes gene_type:complete
MATFTKLALQPAGTTGDGLGILVAATTTAGTAIHTASATATTIDEVWLYAYNHDTVDIALTVEFGGVTSPKDVIKSTITSQAGLILVVPALIVQGNATAKVIRAFAGTGSKISIFGYVNRITA